MIGVVEKFIGDAVMAVWGVPTTHEDDAERSVRAGPGAGRCRRRPWVRRSGVPDLAMRVGIVTGEVAVTVGRTRQGMVAGDPVNTASPVQSAAAPGPGLGRRDDAAADARVDHLRRRRLARAQGQGRADAAVGGRAVVATAGGGANERTGWRRRSWGATATSGWSRSCSTASRSPRRPRFSWSRGDAGVGKSQAGLGVLEVHRRARRTCRWHSGKCVSYGEGVAFYAVAEAVRSRLEAGLGTR